MKTLLIPKLIQKISEFGTKILETYNRHKDRQAGALEAQQEAEQEANEIIDDMRDVPSEYTNDQLRESENNRRKKDRLRWID